MAVNRGLNKLLWGGKEFLFVDNYSCEAAILESRMKNEDLTIGTVWDLIKDDVLQPESRPQSCPEFAAQETSLYSSSYSKISFL